MGDIGIVVYVMVVVVGVMVAVTEQDGCEDATTCLTDAIDSAENELDTFESKTDEEKETFCDTSSSGSHPIIIPILSCSSVIAGECVDEETQSSLEEEHNTATEKYTWGVLRKCNPDAWYSGSDDPCSASSQCLQNATDFVNDMLQLTSTDLCGAATNSGHDIMEAVVNCTLPMVYCLDLTEQGNLQAEWDALIAEFSIAIAVKCIPGAEPYLASAGPCIASQYCLGNITVHIESFIKLTSEAQRSACDEVIFSPSSDVFKLAECSTVMPYCQDQVQLKQLQLDLQALTQSVDMVVSMTCISHNFHEQHFASLCELELTACWATYHSDLKPSPKSSFKFGEMSESQDEYCRRVNNNNMDDVFQDMQQCFDNLLDRCGEQYAEEVVQALAAEEASQHTICSDRCRDFGHKVDTVITCVPSFIVDLDTSPGNAPLSDATVTHICREMSGNVLLRCVERTANCCSAIKSKFEEALTGFLYAFPEVKQACPMIISMLDDFCHSQLTDHQSHDHIPEDEHDDHDGDQGSSRADTIAAASSSLLLLHALIMLAALS